ncbi:MAG: hypothetical protein IJF15_03170 [Oscillospiraceae bacterium]|nr:hypothetical protein [Oscillospiraceae bacterium]
MKKHIAKVILGISLLFFFGIIALAFSLLSKNILWQKEYLLTFGVLLTAGGLFLALYRIIDLLETKRDL